MTRRLDDPNRGDRPSLLELGRRATGEVEGEVPADYARALDEARARLPALDPEILRARSHRLDSASDPAGTPVTPAGEPAPRRRWWWTVVPVLAAAVALVVLLPGGQGERAKGREGVRLDYFVMQDGEISLGDPDVVLQEGDQVQFKYTAAGLDTLVLLGVDGTGALTVYWPEDVDGVPVPVQPGGTHLLEGSVRLDDAPGPEVFVGVFGYDRVDEAVSLVEDAWQDGGVDALVDLAEDNLDVDVLVVDKEVGR